MQTPNQVSPINTLPTPKGKMTWRNLNVFGPEQRGPDFYMECLNYAQYLWLRELPARAILCLDRAMSADLKGHETCLEQFPLPYQAIADIIRNTPEGTFIGNPRVHFQHYADRLGEPRKEIRKWRAWACWAITRSIKPDLEGDPKHDVIEPELATIESNLETYGHPNDVSLWKSTL